MGQTCWRIVTDPYTEIGFRENPRWLEEMKCKSMFYLK